MKVPLSVTAQSGVCAMCAVGFGDRMRLLTALKSTGPRLPTTIVAMLLADVEQVSLTGELDVW